MDSDILQSIKNAETPILELQRQHSIEQVRPNTEFDTHLDEVQYHLIQILKTTGNKIFDDEAQWHTYQNVIAALFLSDCELAGEESRSLEEHEIEVRARGNYNPLGKLEKLDEPTIEHLADRFRVDEVIDDEWQEQPSMSLQGALGGAILNITMGGFSARATVERRLLAAMVCVDNHYETKTVVEVNPVTKTYTGADGEEIEYDTEELSFKQEQNIDAGLFKDV